MKTLLLAILCLCFALSVVPALSQDAPNQAPGKTQAAAGSRSTTIIGSARPETPSCRTARSICADAPNRAARQKSRVKGEKR